MSRGLYGAAGGIREGASGLCAALRKAESAGDSDTSGVVAGETSALVGISSATSAGLQQEGYLGAGEPQAVSSWRYPADNEFLVAKSVLLPAELVKTAVTLPKFLW